MNMTKQFAAAMIALPLLASLAGCADDNANSVQNAPASSVKSQEEIGYVGGQVVTKFVLDGKKFGREKDIDCIMRASGFEATFVCDFAGAGPKIAP